MFNIKQEDFKNIEEKLSELKEKMSQSEQYYRYAIQERMDKLKELHEKNNDRRRTVIVEREKNQDILVNTCALNIKQRIEREVQ